MNTLTLDHATQTDLTFEHERSYLQLVHETADAIRNGVNTELHREYLDHGWHRQLMFDREAKVAQLRTLLRNLGHRRHALCFGKLVEAGYADPIYIGRIGVPDSDYNQLLVDWRTPIASTFYRATAMDPMGMEMRRHFICDGRTLLAMEDDLLDLTSVGSTAGHLVGEGALLVALNRDRTGHMGDIVATIQSDQDHIIRAPMPGPVVVSGGPGAGKTVVALHRAAYLLFTHRERIENNGVLVVGPSSLFLQYIERVLPSLGESMVLMKSWANLLPGITGMPEADPAVADLKGSIAMVEVLRRAADLCRRPGFSPQVVLDMLLTDADLLEAAAQPVVGEAWRTLQRHASQPWTISDLPLIDELGELMGTRAVPLIEAPSRISAEEREIAFEVASATFSPTLSTDGNPGGADISGIVTLQQLIADYLGEEDVPSLVEMARGDSSWLFAHIVVDEAQDVTAMQWRALNRRCLGRSMTIVGDPDQQARPGDDWWIDRIKAGLGVETVDVHSLHINYRTPAELMAPAQQLRARSTSPDTVPTQYVRNGSRPWAARCDRVDVEVVRTAVEQARAELGERGRLAVISGQRHAGIVAQALEASECAGADNGTHRLLRPVAGFLATEVKGLEFDAVLVVDPKTIEAESGWRQLYVVLTRPTRHLGIVMVGAPSEFEARWLDTGAVAELPVLQNVC